MPETESKPETLISPTNGTVKSWPGDASPQKPAGFTLLELGLTLAGSRQHSTPGRCWLCQHSRDPRRSRSMFPDLFCSEECEQEFIRKSLASLTLEDCIRIQRRLDNLLASAKRNRI
jgi:hypothetical protein